MTRIKVCHVSNANQLLTILHDLKDTLLRRDNSHRQRGLLIIDSLPSILINERAVLNHFSNVCRLLSSEYDFAVVTTNLCTRWREGATVKEMLERSNSLNRHQLLDNNAKPMLGKYWMQVPTTRFILERTSSGNCCEKKLTVTKSLNLKIGSSCIL